MQQNFKFRTQESYVYQSKTFKFLTLFVAQVGTIDAGVTSGGFKDFGPPAQTGENFQHKKFIPTSGARSHFLSRLAVKYSVGWE